MDNETASNIVAEAPKIEDIQSSSSIDSSPEAAKSKKNMFIIGGVVAAILVIGGIAFAMSKKSK
ncbi:MAG: hypothetical protein HC892_01550 [Saprospiraceae bacterium]|nr:hypothetical protein [Saprospiraceae bacterium]